MESLWFALVMCEYISESCCSEVCPANPISSIIEIVALFRERDLRFAIMIKSQNIPEASPM